MLEAHISSSLSFLRHLCTHGLCMKLAMLSVQLVMIALHSWPVHEVGDAICTISYDSLVLSLVKRRRIAICLQLRDSKYNSCKSVCVCRSVSPCCFVCADLYLLVGEIYTDRLCECLSLCLSFYLRHSCFCSST
ncbi:hypothetical protein KP509_34G048700 [Ceratopteris richardii]|uniref:Uncharacterized protein n=1 Tax=Ceratopteris richardii TaxID=49495 RepID=A0A8T2QJS2_CERRI|nr:hypothetical protein KP509_34G048700 [Ceratopteris richardii]